MSAKITSINYCPVKSVSFQSVKNCKIKKNIGIIGDRIFAFAKDLDTEQAKLFEKSPDERKGKWNKVLTLKIGRAHVRTPVTSLSRMPSSA